jgi:DNA-binding Lrp family transcriptional regulator
MSLDALDISILAQMRENSRITYKELGKKVGSNINTIATRIKKLEDEGYILGYNANIDYSKIGYGIGATVFLSFKDLDLINRSELNDLISMPETVLAYGITGTYDMIIAVRTKTFDQLIEKIGIIGKNSNIVDMKPALIVDYIKILDDFNPLMESPYPNSTYKERRKPLDTLDLGILSELRVNANQPLRELADKLGAPISTIKERTDKMEYEGIIKNYTAQVNFLKLGYWVKALVAVKLDGNHVSSDETIKQISQIPEVAMLVRIVGNYDLQIGLMAKDPEHAVSVLHKIARLKGVEKTESSVALEVFKAREQFNPLLNNRGSK